MPCSNCPSGLPTTCGQVVVVTLWLPGASSPIPAWLEYNCDGEEPELVFYADSELSEVLDDVSIDEIVSIGAGPNGTSCADSTKVDLCPATREFLSDEFSAVVSQLSEVNLELDSIDSRLSAANTTQANILSEVREYDSVGNPLPPTFSDAPVVFGYVGANMTTMTVPIGASTWVNTLTYNGSDQVTGISGWVLQ